MKKLEVYLVSDSSGETVLAVSKATLVQFPQVSITEHLFLLVRSNEQVDKIIQRFNSKPGIIIYTMGNSEVKDYFVRRCNELSIPALCLLDNIVSFISGNIHMNPSDTKPGKYKLLDKGYYNKINSINFAIHHDDGQHTESYDNADIVLLGISRTSKSPTSLYLGQRGYNVANYPIVLGLPMQIPDLKTLLKRKKPLFIGLTIAPHHLMRIRAARLSLLYDGGLSEHTAGSIIDNYTSDSSVKEEIAYSRSIFEDLQIPIIDVTNKAIEESAAEIINLYYKTHSR